MTILDNRGHCGTTVWKGMKLETQKSDTKLSVRSIIIRYGMSAPPELLSKNGRGASRRIREARDNLGYDLRHSVC